VAVRALCRILTREPFSLDKGGRTIFDEDGIPVVRVLNRSAVPIFLATPDLYREISFLSRVGATDEQAEGLLGSLELPNRASEAEGVQ
jgi:hypothetical protein